MRRLLNINTEKNRACLFKFSVKKYSLNHCLANYKQLQTESRIKCNHITRCFFQRQLTNAWTSVEFRYKRPGDILLDVLYLESLCISEINKTVNIIMLIKKNKIHGYDLHVSRSNDSSKWVCGIVRNDKRLANLLSGTANSTLIRLQRR